MSKPKRKQSLESLIAQLADEPEPRDRAGRKRLELLANVLWSKALSGDDRDALRLLIERLPKGSFDPAPEPRHQISDDPIRDVVTILKSLVERGVIPVQLFEMYVLKKPEGVVEQ
jgi:hypothetical protein